MVGHHSRIGRMNRKGAKYAKHRTIAVFNADAQMRRDPSQWDTDDHGSIGLARIIATCGHGGVGVGRTATTADSDAYIKRGVRCERLNQQLVAPTARRLRLRLCVD